MLGCRFAARTPFARRGLEIPSRRRLAGRAASGQGRHEFRAGGGNVRRRYWRVVNLPHDWAVELPFDQTADGSHGFKPLGPGFPTNSIGWYRRTFELPTGGRRQAHLADVRRRVSRRDGVGQRLARATARGRLLSVPRGHHGRGAFSAARTPSPCAWTRPKFEGWFYEGAGIYRHVWLDKTAPVAIAPDGIFVYSQVQGQRADGRGGHSRRSRVCSTS